MTTPARTEQEAAFRAGAALAHLQGAIRHPGMPLALRAAEICTGLSGRPEGRAALRDALHLTRPGDHPGRPERSCGNGAGRWVLPFRSRSCPG